jgi:hypothetical protein
MREVMLLLREIAHLALETSPKMGVYYQIPSALLFVPA